MMVIWVLRSGDNHHRCFQRKAIHWNSWTKSGADTSASLLGMPAEEDWVLYAPYSDKTMLRNALTFHLGSKLGEGGSPETGGARSTWTEITLVFISLWKA